jgi:hypothetical protein
MNLNGFTYTTLDYVKFLLGADFNGDDDQIWNAIKSASALVTGRTLRYFVPYVYTARFNESHIYDSITLMPRADLLELTAVTNGEGTVIDIADCILYPEEEDPKRLIQLSDGEWEFTNLHSRIIVTGVWGFTRNYARAWGNSLDTLAAAVISATATAITVNNADGLDDRAETRFQVGDYLLIGTEQMQVRDIDTDTNVLTVLRGVNGTTAATHLISAAISVWRQNEDVRWATSQIAVWMYKNKDTQNEVFQTPGGEVRVGGLSPQIWEAVDQFRLEKRRES